MYTCVISGFVLYINVENCGAAGSSAIVCGYSKTLQSSRALLSGKNSRVLDCGRSRSHNWGAKVPVA